MGQGGVARRLPPLRVLVATTAGAGHFGPLVPFARSCVEAGHDVRVAAAASFAGAVTRAGLVHASFADAPPEELGAVFARLPELPLEEANKMVMREVFATIDARAAIPGLETIVDEWKPDVILRETAEFGSYVVADRHDIPHVEVAIGLEALADFAFAVIDDALRSLGSPHGIEGLKAACVLSLVPEALEAAAATRTRTMHRFRYHAPAAGTEQLPAWGDGAAPLVYVTFGTVAAAMGRFPALYRAVIDAVAGLPVRVLVTIGESADPAELGSLPANVHVERFWPQAAVMPHASAMVGHGGFGTTMDGLAHGVPSIVVPLFARDQHDNAAAVARVGAGLALDAVAVGTDLGAALTRVLNEDSFRAGAERVAAAIAALPSPAGSVAVIEAEAAGG